MTIRFRNLMPAGCLLAFAALAAAQTPRPMPVPRPPAAAVEDVTPAPVVAPVPPSVDVTPPPAPARVPYGQESLEQLAAWGLAEAARIDAVGQHLDMLAQNFAYGQSFGRGKNANVEALYSHGQSALDRRRWDEALEDFSEVAAKGGARSDGALYWKAYALNKLGRRDDALGAIAELRKSYASSRWLEDAKALELEVKQASGQKVSPDGQPDDDLKLMALNGLMQTDPDRAIPALDNLLKSAQSPRLKEQALFVLAQSSSPKARQLLEQVARGSGNPDLQVKAIQYLAAGRNRDWTALHPANRSGGSQVQPNNGQLLAEIYTSSNDVTVKRAVLNSLSANRDSDRLLQIFSTEKSPDLRRDALGRLLSMRPGDAVMNQIVTKYAAEQDKEIKRTIVSSLASQDNVKQLVAVARSERDPEMVRYIVSRLAAMKSPEATDYLMEILKK